MRFRRNQHVEDISKDARYKRLALTAGRFAFAHRARIVSRADQFTQRAIAAINLRNFKRPLRVVCDFPTVRRVEQKRDRRVRRAAIGVLVRKANELVGDAAERI